MKRIKIFALSQLVVLLLLRYCRLPHEVKRSFSESKFIMECYQRFEVP